MKPLKCLAIFTAITITGAPSLAQASKDFPSTPPSPGPTPTLHVPTPVRQTLANGMAVISVRRADVPLVTAQVLVRRGSAIDPADRAGLADLTAHLLTQGAGDRTAPQVAAAAEALGGSLDASADWDSSAVAMTVTTPKLPAALALLADVVQRPRFSPDELARARAQAIDALQLQLSEPSALASLAAARGVFGRGAYGHSRGGTPQSLARITRADVQQLHQRLYRPDDAVLILAGDVSPEQALTLAKASFGRWQAPATPLANAPTGRERSTLPAMLVIDQAGAGQAGVVAGAAVPPRSDAGYYAGIVANAVLGGSYSSRLNEEIRIKRGLSYGASSSLAPRRDSGLWLASAQTKNPSAPQVVQLLLGQFAALGHTPVPAPELAARKATLIGQYGRSLETTRGLANQVAELATYGVDLDETGRYVAKVQAVTPAQIATYAKATLRPDQVHVVVVGEASQFAKAMRAAYPDAEQRSRASIDLESPILAKPDNPAR